MLTFVLFSLTLGWGGAPPGAIDTLVLDQGGFTVLKRTFGGTDWVYVLSDTRTGTSLEVQRQGANLTRFIAKVNGIAYSVLHGNGSWKMMPWANRTRNGKFTDSQGATRDLMISQGSSLLTTREGNGNAIHGMVRERPWDVGGFGVDAEGVYLHCYFDTQGFTSLEALFGAFRDHTVYRLMGNRLLIDAYTENKSNQPFENCGWGFHPWINAPLVPLDRPKRGSQADCSLLMPARTVATVDGAKIPTGSQGVAAYNRGYFDFTRLRTLDRDTLTDHYFTDLVQAEAAGYSRTVLIDRANSVRVQFLGQLPFYPWMVLYMPGNDVICVEHQTQEVNGLNTRQNLIAIPAGAKSRTGRIWIEVDGDTTLAFNGPVAAWPEADPGAVLARPRREPLFNLVAGRMLLEVPGAGKGSLRRFDAAGARHPRPEGR